MKIAKYFDIQPKYIDNEVAKGVAARLLIGKADGANHFCMRIFELSSGGYTPKHAHDWEHEIFIHSGSGAVLNKGNWISLEPGDSVFIPGNEEHQIKNMGDNAFIFVCLIPSGAPEI